MQALVGVEKEKDELLQSRDWIVRELSSLKQQCGAEAAQHLHDNKVLAGDLQVCNDQTCQLGRPWQMCST